MLTDEQVDCAVTWWKNILKNPKFDTLGETRGKSIGDQPAALAEIMATASHKEPESEVLDRFAEILRSKLKEATTDKDAKWFSLGTDYTPDKILGDAYVEALGSDFEGWFSGMLIFPWKTMMWFRDSGVQVSYGYGAETEELLLT